jgi:hypothetical protein
MLVKRRSLRSEALIASHNAMINLSPQNVAFKNKVRHLRFVDKPLPREKQKGINL